MYSVNRSLIAGRGGRPVESFSSIMSHTHDEEIKNRQNICHTINVKMINCVKCKLDSEEDIDVRFVGSFLSQVDR